MTKDICSYGCWPSPVSAELAAGASLRLGLLVSDGDAVYWSESRPDEGGRGAIMCARADGAVTEVLPAPWSARSRVHEYGGGEFLAHGGVVWFVEAETQDIHLVEPGVEPRRLTHAPMLRFADMAADSARARLICVAERHGGDDHVQPENFLAGVALEGEAAGTVELLVSGRDFFASPRVSPNGKYLSWLAWDLPDMPWEAAALYVAPIDDDGALGQATCIAGGDGAAVFQPEWSARGTLLFVGDAAGWGNLNEWDGAAIAIIAPEESDMMRPQWVFGMRSWAELSDGRLAAVRQVDGEARLGTTGADGNAWRDIGSSLRDADSIVALGGDLAVFGMSDHAPPGVYRLAPRSGSVDVLRAGPDCGLEPGDVSVAQMLELPSDGDAIHALYYPPASASCRAPDGELPPAILLVHGGPTGRADRGFKTKTQYWTSRGFAVCDVDYSGSAGYGRAYRQRLDGQWGVRDVADLAAAARYLVDAGLADGTRMIVSGGSAGGLTVLLALAEYDIFAAAACSYAVCDLAQLQRITHKFEAGYLYGLTGTTPEDCDAVFSERSPVNMADRISAPVIFFQGSDDMVVPARQTRAMADVLKRRGVPAAYHEFQGEGHGFRRGETIANVLRLEYAFYAETLGLEVMDTLPSAGL